jgi:ribosomal protein S18 acetylase RimI-like enzyme
MANATRSTTDERVRWALDPERKFVPDASVPEPSVRDADPADAEAIAEIGRVAVPDTYKDIIRDASVMDAIVAQTYRVAALRECIARCAQDEAAHFLVAERRPGRILGFLHYDCDGSVPELHRVYVDPTRKRQGIGSALLRELHARLDPGASYVLMVVAANRPAVSFYEHHGFVEAERVDGVTYMHEQMRVEFSPGTPDVPALILRFTKT